jgi:UDP-glucose 4-epimerase
MRILLTGAQGNFGSKFIAQANLEIVQLNRGDWESLEEKLATGIDVILHAASDLVSSFSSSPERLINSNFISTTRLLEAAKKFRIPRFIFLSSCAVYGESLNTDEDVSCYPISINGISKLLNEKIISEFCSEHTIKYNILRVFNMYGGRDKFSIISHLSHALINGIPFTLNNFGVAQRDFIHVADVARIVIKLLEKDIPYTHLNIGTGNTTKISTLVELVIERYPELSINNIHLAEVEYSRANITRLLKLVEIDFIKIKDHINEEILSYYKRE